MTSPLDGSWGIIALLIVGALIGALLATIAERRKRQ
jgi:hypothetical protein